MKIKNRNLFYIGLVVKLALMPFFLSNNFRELFIPFLDFFSENPFTNPWANFSPEHFPYGSALLIIISLPKFLINLLPLDISGHSTLNIFLYKLPLLALDISCLYILSLITNLKLNKSLIVLYWLNPVLIYISYIHGQFDLVSIQFLLLSLYLLSKQKWMLSSLIYSVAILCKFHVIIVLPLIMAYIWNKTFYPKSFLTLAKYLIVTLVVSCVGFLPHLLASNLFYVTTDSPQALSILGGTINYGPNKVLYIGILILFLGLLRLVFSTSISTIGLILGSGFLFNILLVATDFSPGWFYWVLPFYSLAFAINRSLPRGVFYSFLLMFFVHFGIPEVGTLISNFNVYNSLTFTLLQGYLVLFLVLLYWAFVKHELPIKRRTVPIMIGISGDSGSGKNYLSEVQSKIFHRRSKVIEGDDYHKWERGHTNWENYTHLNPLANNLHLMAEHARQLVGGSAIFNHHYNHETGKFTEEKEITPSQIIFFQGLHTLYLKEVRESFDIRIFCSPDSSLRFYWKLQRDMKSRGHTADKVFASLEKRLLDSEEHIDTQKKYADWIIESKLEKSLSYEEIQNIELVTAKDIYYRHVLWNDVPIFELVEFLSKEKGNENYNIKISEVGPERICIDFHGEVCREKIGKAANLIFKDLRSITRSRHEPVWLPNNDGLIQLITIALLSKTKG